MTVSAESNKNKTKPLKNPSFDFNVCARVARWFVFKQKIPIWENLGEPCNGKSWYILEPLGIFYGKFGIFGILCGHLVYFPPVLVFCTKKNLATLVCADLLPPLTSINSINNCVRKLFRANSKDTKKCFGF
jgi:hypothetical protein